MAPDVARELGAVEQVLATGSARSGSAHLGGRALSFALENVRRRREVKRLTLSVREHSMYFLKFH